MEQNDKLPLLVIVMSSVCVSHTPRSGRLHAPKLMAHLLSAYALLVLFSAIVVIAQDAPKGIALTSNSDVPAKDFSKSLRKECPNVSITNDVTSSDYTLEATVIPFKLTLFDHDGKTVRNITSIDSVDKYVRDICHAIRTAVLVEVVGTQTLTQSTDARGDSLVADMTGRRTHTDSSTLHVIFKGEHALLDCYERRVGCTPIGPGKYYAEQEGDGIWITCQMPITHKQLRNHYKIVGGW